MMRTIAVALLLLVSALAKAADVAQVDTIPVKPLSRKAAKPQAPPAPDSRFWLSAMGGLGFADDSDLKVSGFGVYGAGEDVVVGLRARFSEGFGSVRHGRETALMVGRLIGSRQRAWWALGISQLELERRGDRPDNTYRREVIGLPLEIVYAPHGKLLGLELRLEANVNSAYSQLTTGIGFSFGSN